ncbi:MAG: hypothetical protein ACYDCQ_16265 [Dehalococcoidia bacterium]
MPDRFEREIDEILSKIDDFPKHAAQRRRKSSRMGRQIGEMQRNFAVRVARISVTQVMVTAFAVMAFSYFLLRDAFPEVWVYGLILGLILFFTAFALSFRNNGAPGKSEPYFRGRPRSYYSGGPSPAWNRLKAWLQRQRRR